MSTEPNPYHVEPGDLITAQLFNGLQDQIKKDTTDEIKKAIEALHRVDQSGDADKFGGSTPDELEDRILKRALAEIPKRRGYKRIFKRLEKKDVPEIVNHGLGLFPLVDVYQLDYFEVVCGDHEDKENKFVNFYLYHHPDEIELKSTKTTGPKKIIIESTQEGQYVFSISFETMLKELEIDYSDERQSIGDLVSQFWEELFKAPSDQFDPDQYCNSPFFEKCCGDNRSIGMLKQRKNWDNLRFQMRPRKTINFPYPGVGNPPINPAATEWKAGFPNNLEVVHLDFNKIGLNLLEKPFYPKDLQPVGGEEKINRDELKIMLLLKV